MKKVVALGLVAVPALLWLAEAGAKPPKASLTAIRGQLNDLFAAWDLDGDGYLDKEELAKAFRGADAKPYDYKKPPRAKKDDAKDNKDAAKDKQDDKEPTKDKSTSKPDYSSYPDYLFLKQLDTDEDEKISKKEWNAWAKGYARQLKIVVDARLALADAQARLNAATTRAAQRKALNDLKRLNNQLVALNKKMASFEKKLLKAMKTKR
jgi:hypothetical protein